MTPVKPIGTRRLNQNGYVEVKTAHGQRRWPFEHRVVWESIHDSLPKGWVIHHIDGDRTNNAPSNLAACESNGEHHRTYHAEQHRTNGKRLGDLKRGKPHTPEHSAKIAAALRGKPKSPEHRAKISATLSGRKLDHEHAAAIRAGRKPITEERRARLAEVMRQRWQAGEFDYQRKRD
jgi:hypothetical protein